MAAPYKTYVALRVLGLLVTHSGSNTTFAARSEHAMLKYGSAKFESSISSENNPLVLDEIRDAEK